MAKSLTAANAVFMLSVPGLFDVAQQLQGFAADNIFDMENVTNAETSMGVDGRLSAGWVPNPVIQTFTLQADSDSVLLFEEWFSQEQQGREKYRAEGYALLTAVERQYVMTRGLLTNYSPAPTHGRILQPRKFTITWEAVDPSNV